MNGVIVINKEEDFTSFDVVAVVRKTLGEKKVGHTGTLDPNAKGVLPVLLGSATKAQDIIENHNKRYTASFRFGIQTDTLDIWGEVQRKEESHITKEAVLSVIPQFVGEITQIPPMYSAVKVNGVRLYDLARQGKEVERKERKVTVYSIELLDFDEKSQTGTIDIFCSKGTYIRTLIDDIAKDLDTIGTMTSLTRTFACSYSLFDAITLNELKEAVANGDVNKYIKSVESLFENYDELEVSDAQAFRFKNGNPLDIERTALKETSVEDKKIFRIKDKEKNFISLGITDTEKGVIKLYKHF